MLAGDIYIKFPSVIVVTIIQYFTLGSKPISRVPPEAAENENRIKFWCSFFFVSHQRDHNQMDSGVSITSFVIGSEGGWAAGG